MAKKKKRKPITRYVYLFKRISNRDLETLFKFEHEVKIGIAINPEKRLLEVNRDMPGKWIMIAKYKIEKASKIEAELHRRYKPSNIKVKGAKRGSGSTEVFRLSSSELKEIKKFLSKQSSVTKQSKSIFWVLLLSLVAAFIYNLI